PRPRLRGAAGIVLARRPPRTDKAGMTALRLTPTLAACVGFAPAEQKGEAWRAARPGISRRRLRREGGGTPPPVQDRRERPDAGNSGTNFGSSAHLVQCEPLNTSFVPSWGTWLNEGSEDQ